MERSPNHKAYHDLHTLGDFLRDHFYYLIIFVSAGVDDGRGEVSYIL